MRGGWRGRPGHPVLLGPPTKTDVPPAAMEPALQHYTVDFEKSKLPAYLPPLQSPACPAPAPVMDSALHHPRLHGSTSTLSSTSSGGSSWRSRFSSLSRRSSSPKTPVEFWAQFERNGSERKSFSGLLRDLFFSKTKKEVIPENIYEVPEGEDEVEETSFSDSFALDTCPAGLYCVIDDFLSEYELRLFEEEERARQVQKQKVITK